MNWGILLGFLVGGWVNEFFGWRAAFLIVGVPGIALALLVRFHGPGAAPGMAATASARPAPVRSASSGPTVQGGGALYGGPGDPSAPHFCSALVAFAGYAAVIWVPVYLVRIHGLGTGMVGTYLALIVGFGGAAGILLAGRLADRLSATRGAQWLPLDRRPGESYRACPSCCGPFWPPRRRGALGFAVPAMLATVYVAPSFALIQNEVPVPMRAVAAAINLFITNIIGLGLGPFSVGFFSDIFAPGPGRRAFAMGSW